MFSFAPTKTLFPKFTKQLVCLISCSMLLLNMTVVYAAESDYQALLHIYSKYQAQLQSSSNENPIAIESHVEKGDITGTVYAVLPFPFAQTKTVFQHASNWCTALDFHINVKSCTVSGSSDKAPLLHLYIGDKDYQAPEDVFRFDYRYTVTDKHPDYIQVNLIAIDGPLDSKDYRIIIEAIPLDDKSSFMVFSYTAVYGLMTRFMINTYLATAGRHKVGFTHIGQNPDGSPKYIKGIEGLVERNAARYMFAVYSYLASQSLPQQERFVAGLNRWFDFTTQYPKQLYEIGRKEYIDNKQRELKNQKTLQLAIHEDLNPESDKLSSENHL